VFPCRSWSVHRSRSRRRAGLALTAEFRPETALAQTAKPPERAFMTYDIKPLSFDPTKAKGMSEKLLVSHHQNNYSGAVKRLNAIDAQLATLDWATAPTFLINGLKREELIAMNSMILHEHFFNAIGGDGQPSGVVAAAIRRDFGSVDRWRAEFTAMGKAEGGGSGWVVLAYSPRDKRVVNAWASDHTTNVARSRPVMVFDMYEHAYHMDYGANAGAYVDNFIQGIRWDVPTRRYAAYAKET
jgi:superoxide dismutase, Fe-Mn family